MLLAANAGYTYGKEKPVLLNSSGNENRTLSVDPTGASEGFASVLYDSRNGLPTSEANAIAETKDGFIWIGSYAGLIRYDGNTFERVEEGLASIKCLFVDSRDRLWIGSHDNGVAVMEKGVLKKWGKLDGLGSSHIRAITEDENGTIYVGTTKGITRIDPEYNLTAMEEPEIAEANMRNLRAGADGVIYGTTDLGDLMTIRDGKLAAFISKDESPLGGIGAILPDPDGYAKVYLEAADLCFYHVDLSYGFQILEKINIDPLVYLMSLEYIDGKIWITAGNGIGTLDKGKFTLLDNLPMRNNVGHVMTDYMGNLWFTSTRQGVMKVVPDQFSDLFTRYGLDDAVVNTTCMSDDRKLFVGTDTGLLVFDENGPLTELPIEGITTTAGEDLESHDLIQYLDQYRIRSIISDSRNRLWISTWRAGSLLRYDHGKVTAFTVDDGLLSDSLREVRETKDGRIIIALTGGLSIIEGDRVIASYGKEDGIENTESLTVTEVPNGDILLGSNGGGIYAITEDGVKNVNLEDGLPSDIVMRLKYDEKRDVVWIVTSSALAYLTSDKEVVTVEQFPYTNNFDLYENSNGDMWVLSSNGIYVVPAEELLANGRIDAVYFGPASGLPGFATANGYSALTSDGDLYIAGSTGVFKVNIDQPFVDVGNLIACVPFVKADGKTIYPDASGVITVPSSTHKLTVPGFVFNFDLSDPQVSCRLEGFDEESTSYKRSEMVPVDYTNLRGGTYQYIMQVTDAMGRGSNEVAVKIVKEKKFYEKTWFLIFAGCCAVLLLVAGVQEYVRYKTRRLEKKQRETMKLVSEITESFARIIDMKDTYTNGHSFRVAKYTVMLAKELGYDEDTVEKYYHIALLHDIGKIGIPPEVLNKPDKLTEEEFEIMQSHTTLGYETLKSISIMPELAIGAHSHHERPDGRGYPQHLKGDEIPRVAQIVAVADTFDAMYSNRKYRGRMNFEKAVSIIRDESGKQFVPDVVDAFLALVEKGELRDPDDNGGGTTENIVNV
ncbi:MAG: HD domain-containing protein [Lachnospiraceae bacterium]|nr:HD domain-containing protein [Lachnospiraceae bacterium]